ncbi:MAG: glycosyltransferase, partial [Planctomyces sp.]
TVAAAAGGVCSLVQHGRTGFLFAPGRADEAAGYVRQLLADEDLRNRMSAAARADACSRNWCSAVEAVRSSYRQAAQIHAQAPGLRPLSWLAVLISRLLILGFSLCTWRRTAAAASVPVQRIDPGADRLPGPAAARLSADVQRAELANEPCSV